VPIDIEDLDDNERCSDSENSHMDDMSTQVGINKPLTRKAFNVGNPDHSDTETDFNPPLYLSINKQLSTNALESDSETTDGYFSDTGSCFNGTSMADAVRHKEKNKNIDDISEHSSDAEETDSDEECDGKTTKVKNSEKRAKKKVKDGDGTKKKKAKDGQPREKKEKRKDGSKAEP
jgi:hypothetical protein